MADLLRLVLTNFWPFIAALILLTATLSGLADIVRAWRKPAAQDTRDGGGA